MKIKFPTTAFSKLSILTLAVVLIGGHPSLAGTNSGGGALTVNNGLLDFEEIKGEGLIPFSPMKLGDALQGSDVRSYIDHVVNRVQHGSGAFAQRLQDVIHGKSVSAVDPRTMKAPKVWYFRNRPFTKLELETKNIHVLTDNKTAMPVAIQDNYRIQVNRPWLEGKLKGNRTEFLEAIGFFFHEAVMESALTYGIDHNKVRVITRNIFADEFGGNFPAEQFVSILAQEGFEEAPMSGRMLSEKIYIKVAQEFLESLKWNGKLSSSTEAVEALIASASSQAPLLFKSETAPLLVLKQMSLRFVRQEIGSNDYVAYLSNSIYESKRRLRTLENIYY